MNNSFYNRKKKGYTLAEVLTTVMILLILMAIAVPAIFSIRNNMRQKALDSKAELIYTAVQNNLVKLQNNGNSSKYAGDRATQVTANPSDADGDKRASLYYVTSADKTNTENAASVLVTTDTLDADLYNNYWVVEYNPSSASVYAVFYSETRSDYNTGDYNELRDKKTRLEKGAEVGYYGGDMINSGSTSTLVPTLTITNEEKLVATISCKRPDMNGLEFEVTLKDGNNHQLTLKYKASPSGDTLVHQKDDLYEEGATLKEKNETGTVRGIRYTLTLDLDDLSAEDGSLRFDSLYGAKNGFLNNTDHCLNAGTTLTITAKVKSAGAFADSAEAEAVTNSLFADESTANQAVIKYGRHLQNLDEASGVTSSITSAEQRSDIYFEKQDDVDDGATSSWYSCYGDKTFTPITNSNLKSYSANYTGEASSSTPVIYHLTVKAQDDKDNAGLFGTLANGMKVDSVKLSGAKITGNGKENSTIGALAGKTEGDAEITNCQVFLSSEDVTGKTEADYWITNAAVQGGLIGTTGGKVTIDKSFAATVMGSGNSESTESTGSAQKVGGLVGVVNGDITITSSYTDSYLTGVMTGGLVASSKSATLKDCYTAGYQMSEKTGAGLVAEGIGTRLSAVNCYSAVKWPGYAGNTTGTETETLTIYSLSPGTASNSYFLNGGTDYYSVGGLKEEHGKKVDYNTLSNKTAMKETLGDAFVSSAVSTNAYNLKNQGLTGYSYPALAGMPHYGDWEANFEPGSLVYYEVYDTEKADEKYGFFGGNIISTLSDDYTIIGDGYGIAYASDSNPEEGIQITYQTKADLTEEDSTAIRTIPTSGTEAKRYEVSVDRTTYYIYPLPSEIVNDKAISNTYYQKLIIHGEAAVGVSEDGEEDTNTDVVSGGTYYYNPHFAQTAVNAIEAPTVPKEINIRTARQLYQLSLYYPDYADQVKNSTFLQGRDINYSTYTGWNEYAGVTAGSVTVQEPIGASGTKVTPFTATYDGNYYEISGISFSTNATAVGFIAQNSNAIRNVFLVSDYSAQGSNPYLKYQGTISANKTVYMGTLAGINNGRIQNCAVSGYSISGSNRVFVRSNGNFYFGGLTGSNSGTILNCEVDTPLINSENLYGNAYLAGFAGENAASGTIRNSYAIGHVMVEEAKGGKTVISGFTARNAGTLRGDYSAVVLTASGSNSKSYGFAPQGGNISSDCSYLSSGTFRYLGELYAFDNEAGAGTKKTYKELSKEGGNVSENCSYWHGATGTSEDNYPFKAVVTNGSRNNGQMIHYGNWELTEDLGAIGIVYWELEQGGSNDGYHFSYIGYQGEGTDTLEKIGGSTLCQQHDDGGVVTEYGYGYYYKSMDESSDWSAENAVGEELPKGTATYFKTGAENTDASIALSNRLPGFTVVAYTTKTSIGTAGSDDYMRMTVDAGRSNPNGIWEFTYQNLKYTFTINPFFANAMEYGTTTDSGAPKSLNLIEDGVAVQADEIYDMPGTENNKYEIRSADQLQYLNWNYGTEDATTLIGKDNYQLDVSRYPYLGYAENNNIQDADYCWKQTHDVDAEMDPKESLRFTQIGSMYDEWGDKEKEDAWAYLTYFNGSYDGNTYYIKNVEIDSKNLAVGLFGSIIGADVQNIVLYSDNGNYIQRNQDSPKSWYAIGGLCGIAAVGKDRDPSDVTIKNCTVSGYIIRDNSTDSSWGDGSVGGMFGMCTIDLTRCTAVNTIELNCEFAKEKRRMGTAVRVGGLAGSMRGNISSCYTGGEIKLEKRCKDNAGLWAQDSKGGFKTCTKLFLGGITGGIYVKNGGNLTELLGGPIKGLAQPMSCGKWAKCSVATAVISNCYTYIKMPSEKDEIAVIKSIEPIGSNGETPHENQYNPHVRVEVKNCYYYGNNIPETKTFTVANAENKTDEQNPTYAYTNIYSDAIAISWDQLANKEPIEKGSEDSKESKYLLEWLNTEENKEQFDLVTTEENGQDVDGKYTFPGNSTYLEGENFPFPTVLKQDGTINVHYGEWPLESIYWEESRASMDIFEDLQLDENSTSIGWAEKEFKLLIPEKLLQEDVTLQSDTLKFTYSNGENDIATESFADSSEGTAAVFSDGSGSSEDADGFSSGGTDSVSVSAADTAESGTEEEPGTVELSEDDLIAKVTGFSYDETNKCYVTTVRALKTGATIITATIKDDKDNEYRASFNLSVSAALSVSVDPSPVEIGVNESKEVTVHATSAAAGSSVSTMAASEVGQAVDSDGWGTGDSTEELMVSEGVAGMEVFASVSQLVGTDLASRMTWKVESGDDDLVTCSPVTDSKFTVTSHGNIPSSVTLTITGTYTYNGNDYSDVTWMEVKQAKTVKWAEEKKDVKLSGTQTVEITNTLMDESGLLPENSVSTDSFTVETPSGQTTYADESGVMVQDTSQPVTITAVNAVTGGYEVKMKISSGGTFRIAFNGKDKSGTDRKTSFDLTVSYTTTQDQSDSTNEIISSDIEQEDPGFTSDSTDNWDDQSGVSVDMVPDQNNDSTNVVPDQSTDDFSDESSGWES